MTRRGEALADVYVAVDKLREGDPLEVLADLASLVPSVDWRQREAVKTLRGDGVTWEEIGAALGTSRSAAQQRFGA